MLRDGNRGGRGRKSEGSTAHTARKRPERPWTAARTVEALRRCPLAIAQRLVHCAIAVSTAVQDSHEDNVRCTAVEEQPEAKEVQLSQPSSTSLLIISSGLRVQLHLPALDLTWIEYECARQNPSSLQINYPQSGSSRHILPTGKLK